MSGQHTAGNLRACITALLADEESGCDRKHLDALLEKLAVAANNHDDLVTALETALVELRASQGVFTDHDPSLQPPVITLVETVLAKVNNPSEPK